MKPPKFIPKAGIEGLKENFRHDALSGFLVFLLAMPLSLGIAKASQFPILFGLITAIIGGVIVSFFMGSRLSIKGPAAGLIVIVSGSVTIFGDGEQGWHYALGAIVVAGILQVLFGIFKLGRLADFFPGAAIHGMLAAIGIIIMAKQLHLLLGINPAGLKGKEPLELLAMLPYSIIHENAHLAEIGIACLLILILMSYVRHQKIKKIPAPLIVLAVSIPLGFALHIKSDPEIANFALVKIGDVSESFKNGIINADFTGMLTHTSVFMQYVILYSLIGSIESLLTSKAIDGMDPYKRKSNFNLDLIAVGAGNILCGLVGAPPMISEVARSSANISYGARTRWSNFFHGLFLLLAIVFAVPFIEMIPNVALAAMLVFVGFRLAHPRQFVDTWNIGKEQLLIFCITVIVTLATDLLIGVASGILFELAINLFNGTSMRNLLKCRADIDHFETTTTIRLKSELVFSNLLSFKKAVSEFTLRDEITVDVSQSKLVDHSAIVMLNGLVEEWRREGKIVEVKGFENHRQLSKAPTSTRIAKG